MLSPRPRFALAISMVLTLLSPIGLRAAAADPGELDPSFGTGGIATVGAGFGRTGFSAVVPRADGSILAAGGADEQGLIIRYDAAGVLDPTFGTGGVVLLDDPTTGQDAIAGLAGYADGRFLTVSSPAVTVRRFLPEGDPDPSFGVGGAVQVPLVDGRYPTPVGVALQSDGKIVVAGNISPPAVYPTTIFVLRFDAHAVLDPTFGSGGIVTTPLGDDLGTAVHALLITPDGKILVGGERDSFRVVVLRYGADGSLDPSFGTAGVAATVAGNLRALALQPDGKILAVGGAFGRTFAASPLVERLLDDGSLDASFAGDGVFDFDPAQRQDASTIRMVTGVAVQADGKVVVAGTDGRDLVVARLEPTGALDLGYGIDGLTSSALDGTTFPGPLALESGGRALVAGLAGPSFLGQGAVLVRYAGSVCGDATLDADEHCDDGNLVDGDGCDGNCTTTACGNGIATAGEQCDDGNTNGGDCCNAACQLETDGAPCDDANLCTATSTCAAGSCIPGPSTSCDDVDACTGDTCDAPTGFCRNEPLGTIPCQQKNSARENLSVGLWLQSNRFGSSDPDLLLPVVVLADTIAVLSSAGSDTAVEVFDAATGARRAVLPDPSHEPRALGPIAALDGDLLVVTRGSIEPEVVGRIDRYDGSTFALVRTYSDPTPATPGFASTLLGHDGKVIARDAGSHVVEVFDAATGAHLHTLAAPGGDPHGSFGALLVPFVGHHVLVGDTGAVHLFDLESGALVRTFVDPTPGQGAFGAAIAVHGDDVLIGGAREGRVYALDPATGAVRGTFDDPTPQVNALFGASVVVAGDDVVIGRGDDRVHVFAATTRSLRLTILDPLPSDGFCFGTTIVPFGNQIAIADPCFGGGIATGDVETGQVYVFDQATGALRTIVRNPEHDDHDHFTVAGSWHDTLLTYFWGFSEGTVVGYRPCANGKPAFSAKCLDGPCVDPDFCPGPCDFMSCDFCSVCDSASASCIPAPRATCVATARPARTTLRVGGKEPRIDWRWSAGTTLAPTVFGDPPPTGSYGICLYEEGAEGTRLLLRNQVWGGTWRRAGERSVFRGRRHLSGVERLTLQTGRAGRAGITARVDELFGSVAHPVTGRLRIQLQDASSNACWESIHDPADAGRNSASVFRGPATAVP